MNMPNILSHLEGLALQGTCTTPEDPIKAAEYELVPQDPQTGMMLKGKAKERALGINLGTTTVHDSLSLWQSRALLMYTRWAHMYRKA